MISSVPDSLVPPPCPPLLITTKTQGSSTTAGVSGSSSVDPKARRRDRRARKGASGTNGANFAEKMQSALAGLDRVGLDETKRDVNEAEGSAAGRAFRAGLRAESEVSYI